MMIYAGSGLSWPAEQHPQKTAIKFESAEWTFRQVNERVNRLANGLLDLGLQKGERVATLLYNSPRAVEARFAVMKAGLCMVAINVRQSVEENAYVIGHSESSAIILDEEYLPAWEQMKAECKGVHHVIVASDDSGHFLSYEELNASSSPREPQVLVSYDDLERIAYTSGTTGKPKGIMKSIGNDLARLGYDFMNQDYLITPDDVMLNVAPLTHAAREHFRKHYLKGCCNIILRRFNEDKVLETIQNERVTATFLVPTMIVCLVQHPNVRKYDTSSLKRIYFGAAPMPSEIWKRAIDIFGNILRETYGLTECTQPVLLLSPEDLAVDDEETRSKRLSATGKPALGVKVKLLDDQGQEVSRGEMGEIVIQGDSVMLGYWKNPEATKEVLRDGKLYTGDLARMDEYGYIYIVDRKKEMIISGGFNIYPREVEQVIEGHPDVVEVAVIGVPDQVWGESVKALVVRKPGSKVTEEEIVNLCQSKIASYKKPRYVEFADNLPKNFQGKVLRSTLRDRHWKGLTKRV